MQALIPRTDLVSETGKNLCPIVNDCHVHRVTNDRLSLTAAVRLGRWRTIVRQITCTGEDSAPYNHPLRTRHKFFQGSSIFNPSLPHFMAPFLYSLRYFQTGFHHLRSSFLKSIWCTHPWLLDCTRRSLTPAPPSVTP